MDTAQNRLDLFAVMGTAGVVVLKVHAPVHKQIILARVTRTVTIMGAVLIALTIIVHPLTMVTAQNQLALFAVMGTVGVVVLKVLAPVHKQVLGQDQPRSFLQDQLINHLKDQHESLR